MHIKLSFCNEKEYERDERPVTLETDVSQHDFSMLLNICETYIDDPPHYHCRLHNDLKHPVYVWLDKTDEN